MRQSWPLPGERGRGHGLGRGPPGEPSGTPVRRGRAVPRTHESARRNWWGPPFDGSGGCEQVRSPWSSPSPSLAGLATCEPGSRDRPEDHSSNRSGGSTCPFGQDEMYGRGLLRHNGLVHELASRRSEVIPELPRDVDGLWIHSTGRYRMGRLLARLVAAQDGWAKPLGDFNHRWLSALFGPIRPIKDFLNGTWLGHPLHPRGDGPPDRRPPPDGHPRHPRPAGGGGHRPRRDDPVHAGRRASRARPTTSTPRRRSGTGRPSTPR